jgi:hypothetical protein
MKIAITGHTQGIGKGLFQRLSPNAIGFSKSTGYDITNREDRQRIISECSNCDIFINNATEEFGQTYLFLELFEEWKNLDKTIINVGSRIADAKRLADDKHHLLKYQAEKLILKEMTFRTVGSICKIKYRSFAYVGTEKILSKYPHFTVDDYISIDNAVDMILS